MIRFIKMPFQPETHSLLYTRFGYVAAVLGIAAATALLWAVQPLVNLGTIYLVFLVVVVAISVGWGLRQGVLAALLAFLAANFFFIQPLYTFAVAAVQDLLALTIFLGLTILTSQLVARLRRETLEARRGQHTTATLYDLSKLISRQPGLHQLLEGVCERLRTGLLLEAATIRVRSGDGEDELVAHSGALLAEDLHDGRLLRLPLAIGSRSVGVLLLRHQAGHEWSDDEQQLVAAFGEQLQQAIERERLQAQAVETEVLRRTDALRAALLSAVAHDLRNPLASIKAAAGSMLSTRVSWSAEEQQRFLRSIVSEADRINRLVHNLLDMSRIEAGRLQPRKEVQQIRTVVDAVLDRLGSRMLDRSVELHAAPRLPAVAIDAVQIDEVLTNLIENALKYTPASSPIDVFLAHKAGVVEVQVADRGSGVPKENMPFLFDRFYRVEAGAAGGQPGSGLGLAIVKGIVEAHGGQVSAANRPDGGALFSFTVPLATAQELATQRDAIEGAATPTHATLGELR